MNVKKFNLMLHNIFLMLRFLIYDYFSLSRGLEDTTKENGPRLTTELEPSSFVRLIFYSSR